MNTGKIKYVEVIKGYKLNAKALGCKWWKLCMTCPYKDCIKDKKFKEAPQVKLYTEKGEGFENYWAESCEKYTREE